MPRLRLRCRVTGFATGNFSHVSMKGLAADVESLLTVRTLPGFRPWTPIPCLLHLACFICNHTFKAFHGPGEWMPGAAVSTFTEMHCLLL